MAYDMKIKILGVDPSLRNFGMARATFALDSYDLSIDALELVTTESMDKKSAKQVRKNSDDLTRAKVLHDGFVSGCKGMTLAIAEVPVGSQSARSMASYGICVGVLGACPLPLIQVTPSEVKLAAVGKKTASKAEMIEWAIETYPDAPWLMRKSKGKMVPTNANEHLADAVAAIHAGVLTDQFEQATAMMRVLRTATP